MMVVRQALKDLEESTQIPPLGNFYEKVVQFSVESTVKCRAFVSDMFMISDQNYAESDFKYADY